MTDGHFSATYGVDAARRIFGYGSETPRYSGDKGQLGKQRIDQRATRGGGWRNDSWGEPKEAEVRGESPGIGMR